MIIAAALVMAALAPARPLTLKEAIDIAVHNDADVERAHIGTERARLQTTVANLERVRASVDASVQELYAGSTNAFFTDPAQKLAWNNGILGLSNIQGSVSVPLFSGWRVESDIARAEHLQNAADLDLESARQAVAVAVARAYWSERRLAVLEDAQQSTDARLQESERVVLARVSAGLAPGLDKNRAAARRAELDVQKSTLQSQRREAVVRFAAALGLDDAVELTDPLPTLDAPLGGVDALVSRALDVRPELKAAELRGAAADEEKRAAAAGFLPQVDAGALMQIGNNPSIAGAGTRSVVGTAIPVLGLAGNVQAGVTVSINLFDTWATTHAVDDAAHRRRLADADLRAARREVETRVRLAHAQMVSSSEQREALVKTQQIEVDDVLILQHAYERGEVLLTELLDAQQRLADIERQIVDVDGQRVLARVELDAAVGAEGKSP